MRTLLAAVLLLAFAAQASSPAQAAGLYGAVYHVSQPPTSIGAGLTVGLSVFVTNTGTAAWNASGANPVRLSYHWYDSGGRVLVWEGTRTDLAADVAPTASATLNAKVTAPGRAGNYVLRFAMIKEGLAWFDPEPAGRTISATGAQGASFSAVMLPALVVGGTYSVPVSVTNTGSAAWSASPPNPVMLAYHWLDAAGSPVVWDGTRTALGGDLAPSATRTLEASVTAPQAPGTYTLALDMMREGLGWFEQPMRLAASVSPAIYRATYAVGAGLNAFVAETKTIPVSVTNTGNVPWNATGVNPVRLSYHLYDAAGTRLISWDGERTPLGSDVAPGATHSVQLGVRIPGLPGGYVVRVELVRDGVGWFSSFGVQPASATLAVSSGLAAGYDANTAPASITNGAPFPVTQLVHNTGRRVWPAGGPNAVRLSYHIYNSAGHPIIWDGVRAALPKDLAPGESAHISIVPKAPNSSGNYTIKWDMVQEGVAWFSAFDVPTKSTPIQVFPGVTFYGKGWGHAVGLSQWGAQGWASGAAGTPLTGEQIVQKYFPGAELTPYASAQPLRVLLSAPSTGCVGRTVVGVARLRSDGGLRVVKYNDRSQEMAASGPGQTITIWLSRSGLSATAPNGAIRSSGNEPLAAIANDPAKPVTVVEKLRFYKGLLVFENLRTQLRVTNHVNLDDYTRGAVPVEMLQGWHPEAYKAQAYAAATYAVQRQSLARPWDVRDDTSDQCYGGASVETTATNAAVAAAGGRILTYNGVPIRAYYASSHGGSSESDACVWDIARTPRGYACGSGEPYLKPIHDPADLLAVGPDGPNPHRTWSRTIGSAQIQRAVSSSGHYIGSFISMDVSNVAPGGHVISVRVHGTAGTAELGADLFLRTKLLLKSTMVRLAPF